MKKWINLKLCSPKRVLIHVDLVSQSIVGVIYESFGALTLWETIMYIILFQFVSVWNFSVHRRIKKRKSLHVHKLKDSFFNSLAERTGFEPVVPVTQYVSLANWWFQPLTHLSGPYWLIVEVYPSNRATKLSYFWINPKKWS